MKDTIIALIVVAVIVAGVALYVNGSQDAVLHPGQTKVAGVWIDNERIDKFNFDPDKYEAQRRGDTYCNKCGKITEGKVRVCSHCGKYVD